VIEMISEKLIKRLEKLESETEIKITPRYIDADDTIFDVATYIHHNIKNTFFVIECEMKYTSNISSNVYNYSFEVQTVNENRITDFNMKKELKQRLDNVMNDVGYSNNIQIENKIKKIIIQKWIFIWCSVVSSCDGNYFFFSVIFVTGKCVVTGAITGAIVGASFIDVGLMCCYGAYNGMMINVRTSWSS